MSLTSYLTCPNHQALRDKFKLEFPKPTFKHERRLLAPPLTKNYGVVGTAFDYLVRFFIEFHSKEKSGQVKWLADIAVLRLLRNPNFNEDKANILNKRFTSAKNNYLKFIANGRMTNKIIADTLFLAKLDLVIRIAYVAPDLFFEDKLDVEDLRKLYSKIDRNTFMVNKICHLNPTFGIGSIMVSGADADMIIDDTLIDIKVTKHLDLKREYLNQLIGYIVLASIGGVDGAVRKTNIKFIAIYFARHGFLWKIPLAKIGSLKKLSAFKNWMVEYFENENKN